MGSACRNCRLKAGSLGTVVGVHEGLTVDRFTVEFGAGTLDVANDQIMPID